MSEKARLSRAETPRAVTSRQDENRRENTRRKETKTRWKQRRKRWRKNIVAGRPVICGKQIIVRAANHSALVAPCPSKGRKRKGSSSRWWKSTDLLAGPSVLRFAFEHLSHSLHRNPRFPFRRRFPELKFSSKYIHFFFLSGIGDVMEPKRTLKILSRPMEFTARPISSFSSPYVQRKMVNHSNG